MKFEIVQGIEVPLASNLRQEFEVTTLPSGQTHVIFNVSAENIHDVFTDFVHALPGLGFLIIETPCNEVRELEFRKTAKDPFHRDVYYRDGLSQCEFSGLFKECSDILINDGMTRFGFGSHEAREEIFVGGYKVFHLYSNSWTDYAPIFDKHQIKKTEKLTTAWNTFTKDRPGVTHRWRRDDGTDIYEVIEKLMRTQGLYLAKTIEDKR